MDETEKDAVFLFDTLYTTNHIQMLKILLSYFPVKYRNKLAMYIKFQELQYTMEYSRHNTVNLSAQSTEKEIDIAALCQALTPYCTEKEKKMFQQLTQMKSTMAQYQEMMKLMPVLETMMNSDKPNDTSDGFDNLLKNFLSEEQLGMFNMFQNFNNES